MVYGFRYGYGSRKGSTVAPPVYTVAPAISGTARQGQTLSCSTGTALGSPKSYAYQWKRDGVDIAGATASTYLLVLADVGAVITCTVTATNAGGSVSSTTSGTSAVLPLAPTNSAAGSISGSLVVGSVLSVTGQTWANTPTSYAYRWLRDNVAISGATSATYTLVFADFG
ncbi:MAG: hypothetical protein K2Y29_00365, partial [Beijerinckiaceae bacterium]|nr:hypothetical protein [Beijerinckiaceae bacterium]